MKSILIDYAGLATAPDKAMRSVVAILSRYSVTVVKVECDGKPRRTSGVKYREVRLMLADSQSLTLRVKESGDIAQVLINDKVTPLAAQDDPKAAVQEIAQKLDKGREAFQRRQAAIAMKPPEGIKTAAPKLKEQLTAQIAAVDSEIAAATAELADLTGTTGDPSSSPGNDPKEPK